MINASLQAFRDNFSESAGLIKNANSGANAAKTAITADNATHVINWTWGKTIIDENFNPATDTIFIGWVNADALEVTETEQGVVFAIPSNNQSLVLRGIKLKDMNMSNIHALDATARSELATLIDGTPHSPDDHGDMTGTMTMITLSSPSRTIENFDATKDMIHIEAGITAERLQIFEESGDALGLTTRIAVLDENGAVTSTTILRGVGLSDLTLANFSVAEQSAQNEIATVISAIITTPTVGLDGYTVTYDNDGSNPAASTGASPAGGTKYRADVNADDIVGFDTARDQIDVGGTSVHGMIITKTPNGELAIDSPWSNAMQIMQGVQIKDLTMANFAIVGNEHFRQDLGGVMSWELGVGPRESDTVYIRSHEYGVHEVVNNFDPKSMKISFLYFGTRERLTVEDTDAGLKIASLPSGQSLTLTGVTKADLIPGLIEFHHDQVIEDNLEVPFGFDASVVTLVDRTVILTPEAPEGASTDGFQTRAGDLTGANEGPTTPEPEPDASVNLTGTAADDTLTGGSGNDTLVGNAGNDTLNGGDGADTLNGGDGDDFIFGGATSADLRDVVFAGAGNDSVDGGYGNDEISGQDGNDTIAGGFGSDTLNGQNGNDVITGSALSDLVSGNAGDDFLNGGFGHDQINGGSGADRFFHLGTLDHGSDFIQDYNAAEGDVLLSGIAGASRSDFQVNLNNAVAPNGEAAGDDNVEEAFVIYRPTGQILWALIDGAGQSSINLQIGADTFDLLA